MEGFLTVLLFIVVGFWLAGKIGRWTLRRWVTKRQQQFAQQFGGAYGNNPGSGSRKPRPEGEITVTQNASKATPSVSKSVGEYVEFEEEVDVSVEN